MRRPLDYYYNQNRKKGKGKIQSVHLEYSAQTRFSLFSTDLACFLPYYQCKEKVIVLFGYSQDRRPFSQQAGRMQVKQEIQSFSCHIQHTSALFAHPLPQRLSINFHVRRMRQLRQQDNFVRQHIARQLRFQRIHERLFRQIAHSKRPQYILFLVKQAARFQTAWDAPQRRFDFSQLHAA